MSSTRAFGTAYFDDEAEELVNAIAGDLGVDREEFLDELTDGYDDFNSEYVNFDETFFDESVELLPVCNIRCNEGKAENSAFIIYTAAQPEPFERAYNSPSDVESEIREYFPKERFPKTNAFLDKYPVSEHIGYVEVGIYM